jgi:hypothetical protein
VTEDDVTSLRKGIAQHTTINLIPIKNFKNYKDTCLPIYKMIEDCLSDAEMASFVENTDFSEYCTDNLCLNIREFFRTKYIDICNRRKNIRGNSVGPRKSINKEVIIRNRKASPDPTIQSIKARKEMNVLINEFFEENKILVKSKLFV